MEGETYEERAARGARSQSVFRDVNERVREINAAFSTAVPLAAWICECAVDECTERIELTPAEYDEVRADSTRFAIAPSETHVIPEIEAVVARTARYWVVEKTGAAAQLAASVDPRRVGLRGSLQGARSQWRLGQPREDHNVGAQPNGNGRASRGRRERLQL